MTRDELITAARQTYISNPAVSAWPATLDVILDEVLKPYYDSDDADLLEQRRRWYGRPDPRIAIIEQVFKTHHSSLSSPLAAAVLKALDEVK
jgi:hypothetical protein